MSQPTQDPWGNSQTPSQNPQPTQPVFNQQPVYGQAQPPVYRQPQQPPQGYYQQPQQVYYQQPQPPQQQGAWNPAGVYGGAPLPKKKGMPAWGWVLVVVAVLVIIGTAANAGKTSTTTSSNTQQVVAKAAPSLTQKAVPASNTGSQSIGKVGETIAINGYTVTVNGIDKSENFSGDTIDQAKAGNIFIAVDLTIGSQKKSGVSANALFASLKDSQGFKYTTGIFGDKKPSMSGTNDIQPGDKVRGWVTFEVPKTASGFTLEYAQLFESQTVRISLG